MDAVQPRYEFNQDTDPKLRQDESPRLFNQPPPYEFHAEQRNDVPAHPRSFLPYLQEDPNDNSYTETQVRRNSGDVSPTGRDRLMSDADSLLDQDEQHMQNTELYGRDYWKKDTKGVTEPELPPRMAEFEMKHRIHNDETPVVNRMEEPVLENRMDRIPVPYVADSPMMPSQATQPVRMRPLMNVFRDLFMWRNIRNSAVVFSTGLIAISALMYFSFITIVAYSSLSIILLAGGVVFGRQLLYTFQQKTGPHPFEKLMKREIVIKPEYIHEQVDNILHPLNKSLAKMRNLYLADSLAETLKLGLYMYAMTYIGRWFNLMSLVMIGWIMAFSMPRVYVMFRPQIHMVWDKIAAVWNVVQTRVTELFRQHKEKIARRRESVQRPVQEKTVTSVKKVEKIQ